MRLGSERKRVLDEMLHVHVVKGHFSLCASILRVAELRIDPVGFESLWLV